MKPIVAIVAQGTMGTGLARVLHQHEVSVLTDLEGRSEASRNRALEAGMTPVTRERLLGADFLLSVMPPARALPFAAEMAAPLALASRKPIYVDCNAVSPATVAAIAETIEPTGAAFADVGIIGLPPAPGRPSPKLYAAGRDAPRLLELREFGLDVRILDGPIGTASALKMSYAGITKGLIFVASAMLLSASRTGVAEALARELAMSESTLFESLSRRIPDMLPKAYRWVAEMQEIRDFAAADPAAARLYQAAASFYERIAADVDGDRKEQTLLEAFFSHTSRPPS